MSQPSHHNFLPHTAEDRLEMLKAIGVKTTAELFNDIPESLRQPKTYTALPAQGQSELELQQTMQTYAEGNTGHQMASFLGGGAYHRFIPSAVNTIASRSEFYTAYTPYQPEVSQGTLQTIYEFQTMIAELAGLDVANASVYDGGNAVAEAAFMAVRITKRKQIWITHSVNPEYGQILNTYAKGLGEVTVKDVWADKLPTDGTDDLACVIVQYPNYFGNILDLQALSAFCQQHGALLIVSADPVSLGLLEAPGNLGADIVVGDIQPLGNNLSFGGPYGGYMATRQKYTRQLPGRVVGRAKDKSGKTCYTLTLQTREQHIRREKATSNICTNQALNVLKSTVYLTLMGPGGLKQVANISLQRAHALAKGLTDIEGVSFTFPEQPFCSEFAVTLPVPAHEVLVHLETQGILGGIPLGVAYPELQNSLLISVTEMNSPEEIQRYMEAVDRFLSFRMQPAVKKMEAELEVCER
ncbi:MAG: aminomethyl-transferring glycine dehydrogenase subunit GcvPA [Vampirovibrio sp.]|nr:aminomethyl-transferring glycine dehydrogenase subunit GcvPA [Vampirovibrio sp.]